MIKITDKVAPHFKIFKDIQIGQFFASDGFIFYKTNNEEWTNAMVITYYGAGQASSYRAAQNQIFNMTDLVLPVDAEFIVIK